MKEDNEKNLEEVKDQLDPVVKSVSKKQYDHLARAREIKKIKGEIKEKNKKFVLDQLNNINNQIGLVSTQMSNLITKFDSHLVSVEGGGSKRKREETDVEKEIIEPPKQLAEKKDSAENENKSDENEDDGRFNYLVGFGKLIGAGLAVFSLWSYKKTMSNYDKLPSEYLYKNIN